MGHAHDGPGGRRHQEMVPDDRQGQCGTYGAPSERKLPQGRRAHPHGAGSTAGSDGCHMAQASIGSLEYGERR
eukprot:8865164-Heterocapsa_arctica.AAC.1